MRRGTRRPRFLTDVADETDAFARQRLDQPLPFAGVADRAARRVDPIEQRGLRDDAPAPDRGQQIILADHAVAVPDQVNEEIEDLGLDRHQGSVRGAARDDRYRVHSPRRDSARFAPAHRTPGAADRSTARPKEKWRET